MAGLRIFVADDHRLVLDGVRAAFERRDGFDMVGEARSAEEVLPGVRETRPDVVLLDVRMPGTDDLRCLELLRSACPEVKVVMLSVSTDRRTINAALERGASGYIVKGIDPDELPSAVRLAVEGTVFYTTERMIEDVERRARQRGLTAREAVILRELAEGLTNSEIARELWVTDRTVKFHLTNIYRKLGVSSRAGAARAVGPGRTYEEE